MILLKLDSLLLFAFLISLVYSIPIDGNAIDTDEKTEADLAETSPIDEALIESENESDNVIDLSRMAVAIFRHPDNETGNIVARYTPETDKNNPEELGSYLEGDMLVPKKEGRNGLALQSARWPGGVVPYVITGSFSSSDRGVIDRGMREYHTKTCIRFKQRSNENDYIAFTSQSSGCWSSVGRIGGMQEVNLQAPGCLLKIGTFLHEVMHAMGFLHEQNRYERDSYVDIAWNNIQSSTRNNFDKASSSSTESFGVSYDYGSVMHYSAYAFSTNGRPTILAKHSSSQEMMGQRDGFSTKDLQKLNSMYCRHSRPSSRPTRPSNSLRPQRPHTQRPYPPNYNNNNHNNHNNNNNNQYPFLNFLGNLVSGFIQGEEVPFNVTETPKIGQPRTIPSETSK